MGVDYDAKFVYGWIFDTDELSEIFSKMIKYEKLDFKSDEDDCEEDILYKQYEILSKHLLEKYKIYLEYANPYYDCGIDESTFYISLVTHPDVKELKVLLNSELSEDICKLIQHIELKVEDIDMDCIPHIW